MGAVKVCILLKNYLKNAVCAYSGGIYKFCVSQAVQLAVLFAHSASGCQEPHLFTENIWIYQSKYHLISSFMGALKALLTLGIPRTYPRVVLGLIARFWFTVNYEYGKDETQFLFYVYMSVLFFVSLVCSACTSCFTPSKGRRSRPQIRARLASSRTGSRWTTACSSPRHASSSPSHPLSCKWPLNPIA